MTYIRFLFAYPQNAYNENMRNNMRDRIVSKIVSAELKTLMEPGDSLDYTRRYRLNICFSYLFIFHLNDELKYDNEIKYE